MTRKRRRGSPKMVVAGVSFTSHDARLRHYQSDHPFKPVLWVAAPASDRPSDRGPWLWGFVGDAKPQGDRYASKRSAAAAAIRTVRQPRRDARA